MSTFGRLHSTELARYIYKCNCHGCLFLSRAYSRKTTHVFPRCCFTAARDFGCGQLDSIPNIRRRPETYSTRALGSAPIWAAVIQNAGNTTKLSLVWRPFIHACRDKRQNYPLRTSCTTYMFTNGSPCMSFELNIKYAFST